ncbi:Oidioi.mRNA.OKI2018_I69.chr2.g4882.t1.cds [Oikopleura dioica]|uniref:Oidioi.mRNA.OKI2018_I69.chr2.g4882.t1.cds n=1 Tax=Oikopleura dioica TaxID=34765 RepID=A0ABN7T208_OIKDI|nr:Oidioi.mRNA.OKI2018_I69.chr2.g4882.t1.cds [Oikopleura dioica]
MSEYLEKRSQNEIFIGTVLLFNSISCQLFPAHFRPKRFEENNQLTNKFKRLARVKSSTANDEALDHLFDEYFG